MVRNRLEELQARTGFIATSSKEDENHPLRNEVITSSEQKFVNKLEKIISNIDKVESNVSRIEQLQTKIISAPSYPKNEHRSLQDLKSKFFSGKFSLGTHFW